MALSAGTHLGPYKIQSALGAGGMGEVYRAHDAKLDRDVALKVLPEAFTLDPDRLARFEREARVLASLNHPNIAAIYGFEESDTSSGSGHAAVQALVLELVEGPTLADRIAQGPVPIEEALPIARQIAEALGAAHEAGIIHRDLKPANIKLRPDGTVKVLDFGLAKALEPTSAIGIDLTASPTITTPAMTRIGAILGTAPYMSPEQARGVAADKRSDVWAFGCVLYEMLTGEQLFRGETITDVLAAVVKSEPDWSRVPLRTRRLLRSCLEKEPRRRLQAISDAWLVMDETAQESQSAHWGYRVAWLAAGAFALVAAAALWTLWRQPVVEERALQFHINPPPETRFQPGIAGGSSISPDGRTVVFVAISGGPKLFIRRLDSLTPRELPGTTGAAFPFWAPDGRSVGFFAEGKVKQIDVSGGPPVVIAAAPIPRGGTWGPDGTILFSDSVGALKQVAASGGTPAPLTKLDLANGETSHRWPQFLPGGRRFLYWVLSSKPNRTGVYLGSLDRPHEKVFVVESRSAGAYSPARGKDQGYLLWVREKGLVGQPFDPERVQLSGGPVSIAGAESVGSVLGVGKPLFSLSNEGTLLFSDADEDYQLAWLSREGKALSTVRKPDRYAAVRISPDGNRAAMSLIDSSGQRDIWTMELARGLPNRLTYDGGFVPVWSPDGHRIAYHHASQTELFIVAAGGGDRQKMLESQDTVYINDWSPDGRLLMYTKISTATLHDLLVLPTSGDRTPVPVLVTPFDELHGQFFPDGKWIAYTSNESGQEEIYVRSLPAKESTRVSSSGGSYPRWRADGKELFYRSLDGRLMAVSVATVGERLEFGTPVGLMPIVEPLGTFAYPYDLGPNGEKILALTLAGGEHNVITLTVIVNWEAGLKR
jgi:eukaryotic-like serine/threonine-protein kinase